MDILSNAILFLLQITFDTYIFIALLQFLLLWTGIDPRNALMGLVDKLTKPLLNPLHAVLPNLFGIDIAAAVVLIGLEFIKLLLLGWFQSGEVLNLGGLAILAFAKLLEQTLDIFFYAIVIIVIASWIRPRTPHPLLLVVYHLSESLLHSVRRFLPLIAGFDLSPMVALIFLKLIEILVIHPLGVIGVRVAIGGN